MDVWSCRFGRLKAKRRRVGFVAHAFEHELERSLLIGREGGVEAGRSGGVPRARQRPSLMLNTRGPFSTQLASGVTRSN
jgi:hypothetical protein